jgi:hypothetical protein
MHCADDAVRSNLEVIRDVTAQRDARRAERDALREALERIKTATRNDIRAGQPGYVTRYGLHGIATKALKGDAK